MWKGLGQKLKDLAEDLATPPFEADEEEEEVLGSSRHVGHEASENPPPLSSHQQSHNAPIAHGGAGVGTEEEYIEAENGILLPRSTTSSAQKQHPHATFPVGNGNGIAVFPSGADSSGRSRDLPPPSNRRLDYEVGEGPGAAPTLTQARLVPPRAEPQQPLPSRDSALSPLEPSGAVPTRSPAHHTDPQSAEKGGAEVSSPLVMTLQAQVARLEGEKRQLRADIDQYQVQVKQSHDDTVAYYEKQLVELKHSLGVKDGQLAELHTQMLHQDASAPQHGGPSPPLPAEVVEELASLRAKVAELSTLVEALRSEAAEQGQQIAAERQTWQQAQAEHQQVAHALGEARQEAASLRQELQQMREQSQSVNTGAGAAAAPGAREAEVAALRAELAALTAEKSKIEDEMNDLSEGYIRLDEELEVERSARKTRDEAHTAELQQSAQKASRYEAEVAALREQLERLEEAATPAKDPSQPMGGEDTSSRHETPCETGYAKEASEREAELVAAREDARRHQQELAAVLEKLHAVSTQLEQGRGSHEEEMKAAQSAFAAQLADVEAQWQRRLKAALDEDRRQQREAPTPTVAVESDTTTRETLETAVEAAAKERDRLAQELQTVAAQLTRAKEEGAESTRAFAAERAALQRALEESDTALKTREAAHQRERERAGAADASSSAALGSRVRQLEEDRERTADVIAELEHAVKDCLKRNSSSPSSGGREDGGGGGGGFPLELYDPRASKSYTFADWVMTLTAGTDRLAALARKGARVQTEWERTYEEARGVNETLNQQLADAWQSVGLLREEMSVKDETARQLQNRVREGDERIAAAQEQLMALTNELDELREERESRGVAAGGASALAGSSHTATEGQQQRVAQLEGEVEALRFALQEREEELVATQQGLENLQEVLEHLRSSRSDDIAERTLDMQLEIDQLKEQLGSSDHLREDFDRELQSQKEAFQKDMATKNLELTALHRKLAELRRALEKAAGQLNGESTIDKGVVSHILVNFVHSFVGQRKETDEILKILSGLLNWDEEMQERVGLLPGPLNPAPPQHLQQQQQQNQGRRLLSWVRGASGSPSAATPAATGSRSGGRTAKPQDDQGSSLASMWVDFLMKESEQRATTSDGVEGGGDGQVESVPSPASAASPLSPHLPQEQGSPAQGL